MNFPKVDLPKQPKPDIGGTIFEMIFGKSLYIEDLPSTETKPEIAALRSQGVEAGDLFTKMVHVLRSDSMLPESVRKLAVLLWDLVGYRITPVACGFGYKINSVHFWAEVAREGSAQKSVGCIMVPPNWVQMVNEDAFMQFGAIVYSGSQARDFYNERLVDGSNKVIERAKAFESEYLQAVTKWLKPNDYQKSVLLDFPKGLASLDANLRYESKPFAKPT